MSSTVQKMGFLCLLLCLYPVLQAAGQKTDARTDTVVLSEILLSGNKKTEDFVILREMDLQVGDTLLLGELETIVQLDQNRIYNSNLFEEVSCTIEQISAGEARVLVQVVERWYTFLLPIFELSDRNFNEWWVTYDHDLRRTEYGLRFYQYNVRGHDEVLSATIQFGFTKNLSFSYRFPNLGKRKQWTITPGVARILNSNIPYTTTENQLAFYKHDSYVRKRWAATFNVDNRLDLHRTAKFEISYFQNEIGDTIAQMNPDYFLNGDTKQQYLFAKFLYARDFRDIVNYPLKGSLMRISVSRYGLGLFKDVNFTSFTFNYSKYFPIAKRTYGLANFKAKLSLPEVQPYFNQKALGYGGNHLRGYEYYVIDGQRFLMLRSSIRQEIFYRKIKNPFPIGGKIANIPLSIYLKGFAESAYVQDDYYQENGQLANRWISSTGIGLDFVTFYDSVWTLEYSRNREGESGIFVHFLMNYDSTRE